MNDRLTEFLISRGTELAKELPKHDQDMIRVGWKASRIFTLKEVGELLGKTGQPIDNPFLGKIRVISEDFVEALKRGDMPR